MEFFWEKLQALSRRMNWEPDGAEATGYPDIRRSSGIHALCNFLLPSVNVAA